MIDPFADLILKLGTLLRKPIHLDHNNACALRIQNKFVVQLQLDQTRENVLIASFVKEIPPGKYRENVFCEALKTNNLADPRPAILSYALRKNSLALHRKIPFESLTPITLEKILAEFIDTAKGWYEALSRGEASPSPIRGSANKPNPFGLIR